MKTREPVLLLLAFFFFFFSMQTIDTHIDCNPVPSLTHYQCYQLKNSLTSKGRVQTDFWEQPFCKQTGIRRDVDLQKAPPPTGWASLSPRRGQGHQQCSSAWPRTSMGWSGKSVPRQKSWGEALGHLELIRRSGSLIFSTVRWKANQWPTPQQTRFCSRLQGNNSARGNLGLQPSRMSSRSSSSLPLQNGTWFPGEGLLLMAGLMRNPLLSPATKQPAAPSANG